MRYVTRHGARYTEDHVQTFVPRTARHSGDMTVKPNCMLLGELVMVLSNKLMRRYGNASKWGTLQLNDTMTHESGLKFQNASKLWRLLKYVWTTFGHVH